MKYTHQCTFDINNLVSPKQPLNSHSVRHAFLISKGLITRGFPIITVIETQITMFTHLEISNNISLRHN